MIVITGAGGFIGSVLVGYLNAKRINDLVLYDDLPKEMQFKNLIGKQFTKLKSTGESHLESTDITCVVHLGANSNTLENNWDSIYKSNVLSTRQWNQFCNKHSIPFIFASSASIHGNGKGPLNHYAFSKQLSENEVSGVILRLYNVYGPNEYHKERMASTVYHWYKQLKETGRLRIFEGSKLFFRDFVYVETVCDVIYNFINNYAPGTYDVGCNHASFDDIADIMIASLGGVKDIVAMPSDLKKQYQINTKADIAWYEKNIITNTLEHYINQYINYLQEERYY
jgi:ADP-L-glycero-D-manno-heptose 6-epimerase